MQFMMKGMPVKTDLDYIKKRRVSHHDIEHMVTGFGPNELGEQALSTMNVTSAAAAFTPQACPIPVRSEHLGDGDQLLPASRCTGLP